MSNENDQIEQTIREMAKLTMLSNKINEIQEKNLKMFPLVFFNGVRKVVIDYDLTVNKTLDDTPATTNSWVHYDLTIDETQENPKLDFRFEHLEKNVRNLFWNNVKIKVLFNDRIVFESKK